MNQQPNILFIFTDQQSFRAMSCTGNPYLHTPHMDSIARSGVRFDNCYCTSPVCGPSRSSIVTGRMPHETGVIVNNVEPDPTHPTMGELLSSAGYATAWTGKWHVPEPYLQSDFVRGFEYLPIAPEIPVDLGADVDEPIANRAIEYLQRQHSKPFMLGVSLTNPHDICFEIVKMGKENLPPIDSLPPLPPNFEIDPEEAEYLSDCRQRPYYGAEHQYTKVWNEHQWRTYLHIYYRLTEQVDATIGRILQTLREQGLEESTLVVLTSDHGEGMAAHHWVAKLMLWEETAKVPLLVQWKGVLPAGRVDSERLVSLADILPTFCDYAGMELPQVTGQSLRPVLEDPAQPGREFVVTELQTDPKNLSRGGRMIRTTRYKYCAFSYGRNAELFFDLVNDPCESKNLSQDASHENELKRHRSLLRHWMEQTHDNFSLSVSPS